MDDELKYMVIVKNEQTGKISLENLSQFNLKLRLWNLSVNHKNEFLKGCTEIVRHSDAGKALMLIRELTDRYFEFCTGIDNGLILNIENLDNNTVTRCGLKTSF